MLKRGSGSPVSWGSSQARAFTATTTLGGKAGRSPDARPLFEADETFLEEPLAPLADDLPRGIEATTDLIVAEAVGGIKGNLGADDVSIRRRICVYVRATSSSLARVALSRMIEYGLMRGMRLCLPKGKHATRRQIGPFLIRPRI
jgi:hypothetical protein